MFFRGVGENGANDECEVLSVPVAVGAAAGTQRTVAPGLRAVNRGRGFGSVRQRFLFHISKKVGPSSMAGLAPA